MTRKDPDDDLIRRLMQRVSALPDLWVVLANADPDEMLPGLAAGHDDSIWAHPLWKPWAVEGESRPFDPAYPMLPVRFPPLYERMAERYRWLTFCVPDLAEFYGNSSEAPLESVLQRIESLGDFSRRLLDRGMLPFGMEYGDSSDPLCFDSRRRRPDGDCPVIRVGHESVLMGDDDSPWQTWPVAQSFRELLEIGIVRLDRIS